MPLINPEGISQVNKMLGNSPAFDEAFKDQTTLHAFHHKHCGRVAGKFNHRVHETDERGRNIFHYLAAKAPPDEMEDDDDEISDDIKKMRTEFFSSKFMFGTKVWDLLNCVSSVHNTLELTEELLLLRDKDGYMPLTLGIASEERRNWFNLVQQVKYKLFCRYTGPDEALFKEVYAAASPGAQQYLKDRMNRARLKKNSHEIFG